MALTEGREYFLSHPFGVIQWDSYWLSHKRGIRARYVQHETLPIIGGEWETFYKFSVGGTLFRMRVPADTVEVQEPDKCLVRGEPVITRITNWGHTPIVNAWLEKVAAIEGQLAHQRVAQSA